MNDLAKNLIVWLVLAAILMSVFNSFAPEVEQNNIDYSDFINEVQNDRVSEVVIADLIITGERNDGTKFRSVRPNMQDPKLMDDLMNHNVRVIGKEKEEPSLISQLLVAAFPILLILAIFMFFSMANIALPGTSSFVGEFLILAGVFKESSWIAFLLALVWS
mgnify:CR=1 FL=1